jgi:hypothetical protein
MQHKKVTKKITLPRPKASLKSRQYPKSHAERILCVTISRTTNPLYDALAFGSF